MFANLHSSARYLLAYVYCTEQCFRKREPYSKRAWSDLHVPKTCIEDTPTRIHVSNHVIMWLSSPVSVSAAATFTHKVGVEQLFHPLLLRPDIPLTAQVIMLRVPLSIGRNAPFTIEQ